MPTLKVISSELRDGAFKIVAEVDGLPFSTRATDDADLERQALAFADKQLPRPAITLGIRTVTKPVVVASVPTQAELDLRAFAVLCEKYRRAEARVKLPDGKTTTLDLAAIRTDIKAAYKPLPEYDSLIVGLF